MDFDNGIKYLKLWFKTTDEVTAQAYVLLGQAYFLQDQFQKAYNVMMEAKEFLKKQDNIQRELVLNLACYHGRTKIKKRTDTIL